MNDESIEIGGRQLREGTSIYDTAYDRVLWLRDVNEYEVTVEVVDSYRDDDPVWWTTDGDPTRVEDGAGIGIDKLTSLVEAGRFEIGPQPYAG